MPVVALAEFASSHHGLYRSSDARRLGFTDHQVAARVRRGLAERVGKGVFRVAGGPRTRQQELLAAVWRTGGVVSHRSASYSLGMFDRPFRSPPELTVDRPGSHEHAGLIVHRSSDLGQATIVEVDGIPTTGPARTLVDLGQVLGRAPVERAVHRALHLGLLRLDHLVEEFRLLSRRGRPGCAVMREILTEMDPTMAPAESDLEVVILTILRRAGLPEPVRQFDVVVDGRTCRLDLAYPEQMVFLEGDGFGVHGRREMFESDRARQNALVLAGWRPLRFTWRQARNRPDAVVAQVGRAIGYLGA